MATQITVPALGESVTEATVAKWFKSVGDAVAPDEPLVELETDKVTVEVNAPSAGVLSEIKVDVGATVEVGAVLGAIGDGAAAPKKADKAPAQAAPAAAAKAEPAPAAEQPLSPAVRKMVEEKALDTAAIQGTGKGGRITKGDVIEHLERKPAPSETAPARPAAPAQPAPAPAARAPRPEHPREERVRMTRLRKRIAERLKEAQNTAAMLTTFNEVDMSALMSVRGQYKDQFEKRHGVKLGFMSFFVKACVTALKEWPAVNGEVDGDDLVYKNYYDIGVAVGTPQGLVVPVVRDADRMSFAEIEKAINDLGRKARDGKLSMEELTGGTFTISNGGVYGSLLSTPILNPPQSGILGMHKIEQRPVVVEGGRIEARPMMYLALSYDHRIIDGREAVSFLVRVKECIEDPQRILLEM
ncbi:MAG: 2-oxoglutarate dehydrogenase complex dihydrolipoyllysine-residue succinyltransferase [Rhodospirillales bacterium]|nr:2-oxoglutarate dehydrogenase complex dihydrolipoyllysine-residue succinyltransferase [Rhodospirillales bacterium]